MSSCRANQIHVENFLDFSTAICWSLAVVFWGIVALSVHSIRHASRASSTRDLSCTRSRNIQTQIAEALIFTVLIAWYRDAIAQKTSPYKELFSMCDSSARWEVGHTSVYYWGSPLVGITLSQCDLATAIANVTWVGPVALLFAVWIMLLKWLSSPAEVLENVPNAAESVSLSALRSVQSLPGDQRDNVTVGIKQLVGEYSIL
ncbi:hypothetical protein BJ912DRAFT_383493 [Pholiota molesta]|nr:hypothetical protein BJ912DRAFT_383493 [Pholiota molesta]